VATLPAWRAVKPGVDRADSVICRLDVRQSADHPITMAEKPPPSHEKVSRWDRPKPPRDWRWFVGGLGRILITLGLMMFAFVAYQLWGTGIQTAQAQRTLSEEFDQALASVQATAPSTTLAAATSTAPPATETTVSGAAPTPTTTMPADVPAARPVPDLGKGVARLEIPRIGVNRIVVEGATAGDLTKGPGHFPETPLPGQLGNAAIAGHRTTHLAPFFSLEKMQQGDEIIVTTLNGRYVYQVTGSEEVAPEDYAAVIPTTDVTKATLTLVTCTPRYTATNRLIIHSELVAGKSNALTEADPAEPVVDSASPEVTLPNEGPISVAETVAPTATTAPAAATPNSEPAAAAPTPTAFVDGWFSDKTAIPQAIMWGIFLIAVAVGIYWISRLARRYWVGFLVGFAPFLVVLYFFYENVNRLLPPNL
jgi:sortase A